MTETTPLTSCDTAVKVYLTTSPQQCQQLASEVGNRCWGKILWTALRLGARQWPGFGPELQPEEELDSHTDDWAYVGHKKQPAQDERGYMQRPSTA